MTRLYLSIALILLVLFTLIFFRDAKDSMVKIKSDYSFIETSSRLERALTSSGMVIFSKINHSSNAVKVDINLRNTELFIFGKPQVGSQLMRCNQKIGLELPLKILVWKDEDDNVWLLYKSPNYLKSQFELGECKQLVPAIEQGLVKITSYVTTNAR